MSTVRSRSLVRALAVAAFALPLSGGAQGPVSTGANVSSGVDTRWEVAFRQGGDFGAFFDAFVVDPIPGVWEPNTLLYRWIGATPNGSLGGGPTDYIFRLLFDASVGSRFAFRCATDNVFGGYRLNGGSLVATGCTSAGSRSIARAKWAKSSSVDSARFTGSFFSGPSTFWPSPIRTPS